MDNPTLLVGGRGGGGEEGLKSVLSWKLMTFEKAWGGIKEIWSVYFGRVLVLGLGKKNCC